MVNSTSNSDAQYFLSSDSEMETQKMMDKPQKCQKGQLPLVEIPDSKSSDCSKSGQEVDKGGGEAVFKDAAMINDATSVVGEAVVSSEEGDQHDTSATVDSNSNNEVEEGGVEVPGAEGGGEAPDAEGGGEAPVDNEDNAKGSDVGSQDHDILGDPESATVDGNVGKEVKEGGGEAPGAEGGGEAPGAEVEGEKDGDEQEVQTDVDVHANVGGVPRQTLVETGFFGPIPWHVTGTCLIVCGFGVVYI
jgi:hypothetical protein